MLKQTQPSTMASILRLIAILFFCLSIPAHANTGLDGPLLSLRTTTDKPTYNVTDVVMINALLQNLSLNTLVDDVLLTLTIEGPDGQVVHTQSQPLKVLALW